MDEGLLARFRRECAPALPAFGGRLAVAVSGGPDSLALLLLAARALPSQVIAATVDHGLRPEAAAEAAMVASLCSDLGVEHSTLTVTVADQGEGMQAAARRARYAALAAWAAGVGVRVLATAHHADDQAETLLMRLMRGSGVGGLAGIRASRPLVSDGAAVRLIRPLLGWRKAELAELVRAAGLTPVVDPSNSDPRHDRTHVRALLAREGRLDAARLAASARALAEAEAALAWSIAHLMGERIRDSGGERWIDAAGLPQELRRRLLAAAFPEARGDAVMRLLDRLDRGEAGTLGDRIVRPGPHGWHVAAAPPRRSA